MSREQRETLIYILFIPSRRCPNRVVSNRENGEHDALLCDIDIVVPIIIIIILFPPSPYARTRSLRSTRISVISFLYTLNVTFELLKSWFPCSPILDNDECVCAHIHYEHVYIIYYVNVYEYVRVCVCVLTCNRRV